MALVDRWAPPAARVRLEGAGGLRAACSVCAAGAEGGVGDRPPGDAMMPGVSTKELGEAAATRLSSSQPGGGGTARALNRGGSLEDTVKQQAATIHAQALKLSQLQVRPPALPAPRGVPGVARAGPAGGAGRRAGRRVTARALRIAQGLLDFALKQKSEEDLEDEKRVRQLEEIIALKDKANKDLKSNVRHLEDALAETKMNLEFMHSKWRDEAASHEQALADLKAVGARMAHLEDEQRRHKERESEANARVAAARSDALDRVQELQEMHLRHGSVVTAYDQHRDTHAKIKERLSGRLVRVFDGGIKKMCFTHWLGWLDESRLKKQVWGGHPRWCCALTDQRQSMD